MKWQAVTHHTCNLGILQQDTGIYPNKVEPPETFGI